MFQLHGRSGVFDGVSDFAYLPRDAQAEIRSAAGGRFALAGARCERELPAGYGPAEAVPVELRGAGHCSRQVNNFAAADTFPADRLIAVEVLTPGGNWSSYPPHKHDEHHPGEESRLEEIYYFEIAPHGDTPGSAISASPLPGGEDRHPHRGAHRGRGPDPRRLARPVHRRPRARHVLPERDGRTGRHPGVADPGPPRPRLDPRQLGRPGHRPPAPLPVPPPSGGPR